MKIKRFRLKDGVASINIEIVEFHHSIVTIQGEYRENG